MNKKNKRKKRRLILISILILLICISTLTFYQKKVKVKQPVDINAQSITYTISDGMTPFEISQDLEEQNIIRSAKYLTNLFIKNNGLIYANTYQISPSQSSDEIYEIITSPTSNVQSKDTLLVYEGEQLTQIASKLSEIIDTTENDILNYWNDKEVLKELISKYEILDNSILDENIRYPLEGYFYPATYPITSDDDIKSITEKMLNQSEIEYKKYIVTSSPQNLSFHESLTLASIVERETMTNEDKYKVAGVFYNRINQDMPLQSDITVLYAKNEQKELVTYEDLEYDSPYNTYQNTGLPPGPISSVSIDAIDSVYNPEENDYLYFFAKQDTGEVLYSKTLEEHEAITEEYAWT